MGDKFERHLSTRWAKAEMPSYGDDWDDVPSPEHKLSSRVSDDQISQKPTDLADLEADTGAIKDPQSQNPRKFVPSEEPKLVLSIDSLSRLESDSSSSDESAPDVIPDPHFPPRIAASLSSPDSENSFLSDADSIQKEPAALNLLGLESGLDGLPHAPGIAQPSGSPDALQPVVPHETTGNSGGEEDNTHIPADATDKSYDLRSLASSDEMPRSITKNETLYDSDASVETSSTKELSQGTTTALLPSEKPSADSTFLKPQDSDEDQGSEDKTHNAGDFVGPGDATDLGDGQSGLGADALESLLYDLEQRGLSESNVSLPIEGAHDRSIESVLSSLGEDTRALPTAEPLVIRKALKRKPPFPRQVLVSGDYSNIAEAMDGYLDNSLRSPDSVNDSGHSKELSEQQSNKPTAKSVAANAVQRHESTMSTKTFNLGGWTPNTSQFRDQFIHEDDAESRFSFVAEDEEIANRHSNFINKVEERDVQSSRSSFSLNETIDLRPIDPKTRVGELQSVGTDDALNEAYSMSTDPDSVFQSHPQLNPRFTEEQFPHETTVRTPLLESTNTASTDSNTEKSDGDMTPKAVEKSASAKNEGEETKAFVREKYPVFDWKAIQGLSQPIDRIQRLKEALVKEAEYDTGLQAWLNATLKPTHGNAPVPIGKIALEAYQNATHRDIRRHVSIRTTVNNVKDKVETTSLGKRFFNRGRKLISHSSGASE